MVKIISNEIKDQIIYGKIKFETEDGIFEFSYETDGNDYEGIYTLRSGDIKKLSNDDLNEIDNIITKLIRKI